LTALAQTVKHVKNLHVVAHVEENSQSLTGKEITLLYKVAEGKGVSLSLSLSITDTPPFADAV